MERMKGRMKQIAPFLYTRAEVYRNSTSVKERLAGAVSNMHVEEISLLLDDKLFYNDMAKSEFISQLEFIFSEFVSQNDDQLRVWKGHSAADRSLTGFRFVGNRSGDYFEILIENDGNKITAIRECEDLSVPVFRSGRRIRFEKKDMPF